MSIIIVYVSSGGSHTNIEGMKVIGVIKNTILNISVKTFSENDSFFTKSPVIAWVIAAARAKNVPICKLISGLIITTVNRKPKII